MMAIISQPARNPNVPTTATQGMSTSPSLISGRFKSKARSSMVDLSERSTRLEEKIKAFSGNQSERVRGVWACGRVGDVRREALEDLSLG